MVCPKCGRVLVEGEICVCSQNDIIPCLLRFICLATRERIMYKTKASANGCRCFCWDC